MQSSSIFLKQLTDYSIRLKNSNAKPKAFFDFETLAKNAFEKEVSHEQLCVIFNSIIKEKPSAIFQIVFTPFILSFGEFFFQSIKRWPTLVEVDEAATIFFKNKLPSSFVEKRTKYYSLRKIARANLDWDASLSGRRGALKQIAKVKDMQNLLDHDFANYLQTPLAKSNPANTQLQDFFEFAIAELGLDVSKEQQTQILTTFTQQLNNQ